MATYNKFQKDLETGHYYEERSLLYLDYDTVEHKKGYFKEYDLEIVKDGKTITIEVKSDKQASRTGNLAIEYECNNKPSGITSSTADFWIYFIVFEDHEEVYKVSLEKLKKIAKKCRKVSGGDNMLSRMYLVPKNKLSKYLINFKNKIIPFNIQPTMSDQKDTTKTERPLSFSKRLIQYIESNPLNIEDDINPNITQITTMINQFSLDEYEKRKQKTDEMPFGKYKFRKVSDVANFDKQYLKWLRKQDMLNKYEELKDEIDKYL